MGSAKMCPSRNVKMFPSRFATVLPNRSAIKSPERNVSKCPDRAVKMYLNKNVKMYLNNSSIKFQDKAAQHSTFVQFVNSRPTVKPLILVFYSLSSIKQIPSSQTSI